MRPIFAALIALAVAVTPTYAQGCQPGAFRQDDLAGIYVDPMLPMRVQLSPCGGATVLWDNIYGRHQAHYIATDRLPGGGVVARGLAPDQSVGYLDNAYTIAFKPAEPGFLQVITASPYGEIVGIYRLPKTD